MREALKSIGLVFGAIVLIVLAFLLVGGVTPIAFIWLLYVTASRENRKARDIIKGVATYFVSIASSLDKFGNCAFGGLFNDVFLIKGIYKFGENTETISEVLGWAYKFNDLNKRGLMLRRAVDWVDFFTDDHCEVARMVGLNKAKKKINTNFVLMEL